MRRGGGCRGVRGGEEGVTPEAEREIDRAQCLPGRLRPADIARMALWLAADDSHMHQPDLGRRRRLVFSMTRSLILSGGGAYADPWHPFGASRSGSPRSWRRSGTMRDLRTRRGPRCGPARPGPDRGQRRERPASRHPRRAGRADGRGWTAAWGAGHPRRRLHAVAAAGLGVGDRRGVDHRPLHAPEGRAVPDHHLSGRHPICAPVADFDITDERYAYLRTAPDIVPLAVHEHAGELHPLLWARKRGEVTHS